MPNLRYPPTERMYLLSRFRFAFPDIDDCSPLVPLLDHLFGLAIEARRLREKLPKALTNERQEADYVWRSLDVTTEALREVYEPLGQEISPPESRLIARQINTLERDCIGPLIEAIRPLVKPAK